MFESLAQVQLSVGRTVKIRKVATRPTPLEVTAQEILTKDPVRICVTLTAFTRVVDPEKADLRPRYWCA